MLGNGSKSTPTDRGIRSWEGKVGGGEGGRTNLERDMIEGGHYWRGPSLSSKSHSAARVECGLYGAAPSLALYCPFDAILTKVLPHY